ncbi:GDSL esterase/lipase 5 [Ricinus communis]|uniref:Zinc finger protein, putative n=1 Tax=Ricinus communis TaxID=3988 RepID=B9RR37_RICCO|nr:GDSL esterase/lipase 5 [Ricinus communis]EEF46208.1 zinc finger protein, putative [Ricinus communis]|eukprot:XP_002516206.1 GDSL esterase/lipase 5 [Ricinus communis]
MAGLNSCIGYSVIFVILASSIGLKLEVSAAKTSSIAALFIFGDSSVDAGNNNYINTIPENRADMKPYGQNGIFQAPTGRFSDGRIIVDYIAQFAKLPLIPPFLQPSADYIYGANFASGGGGVLPETNQGMVIDLPTQLKYFEEVEKSLTEKLGETRAKEIIEEAVYFISIGSNDYMGGYLGNPKMQENYIPEVYVGMVIGNLTNAIQALYQKGARKFAFLSLCPLGCLPTLRALNPKASEGGCFEAASSLALAHNNGLKAVLISLEHLLKGFKYCNSNFYNWLNDRINNPTKYGFKDGVNACCGTGPYGGIFTCGGNKKVAKFELCENANEYVWWDSFHPTERIHAEFAKTLWNGPPFYVGAYNLEDLFFNRKLTIADTVDAPDAESSFSIVG